MLNELIQNVHLTSQVMIELELFAYFSVKV